MRCQRRRKPNPCWTNSSATTTCRRSPRVSSRCRFLAAIKARAPLLLLGDYLVERNAWLANDALGLRADAAPPAVAEELTHWLRQVRERHAARRVEPAYLGGLADDFHETEAELFVPPRFRQGSIITGPKVAVRASSTDGDYAGFRITPDGTAIVGLVQVPWGQDKASTSSLDGGLAIVHPRGRPEMVLGCGRLVKGQYGHLSAMSHGSLPPGHILEHAWRERQVPGELLSIALVHPQFRRLGGVRDRDAMDTDD